MNNQPNTAKRAISAIKMLVMDVDGTLTDGKIYMGNDGEVMKAFDVKDGYAISVLLPKYGIKPVIITGRQSKIVENRALELGVTMLFQGIKSKLILLKEIAAENGVTLNEIACIGDDLNDLDCIKTCGLSGCPADAVSEVKEYVDFVSYRPAGSGAVRDFVDWIIANEYGKAI
jgi:3-deoxy-D-manno-octulosonate 8-phosphate phosphatase (KDO 8-P phosphatase)